MSGGSLDYAYGKIDYIREELDKKINRANDTTMLKMLSKHLYQLSECLYHVEWFLSDDYTEEDALIAIKKLFGNKYTEKRLEILKEEAKLIIEDLKKTLEEVK